MRIAALLSFRPGYSAMGGPLWGELSGSLGGPF
nr:MAG TPA: hypothetical protein [Microviridae sp.]